MGLNSERWYDRRGVRLLASVAIWMVVVGLLTWFLFERLDEARNGTSTNLDMLAFAVWAAAILAPVFGEISVFGVTVRRQLSSLQESTRAIATQVATLATATSLSNSNVNVYYQVPEVPTAEELSRAKSTFSDVFPRSSSNESEIRQELLKGLPDGKIQTLVKLRQELESEIDTIARDLGINTTRNQSFQARVRSISSVLELNPKLVPIASDVYAICSQAIHGRPVTDDAFQFAIDAGTNIISTLRKAIEER